MKRVFLAISLLLVTIILISACNKLEKYEHIEVYVTEIVDKNDEDVFETIGYKKVNAITNTEEVNEVLQQGKNEIKSIEDFYDLEGNYIKTVIIHSTFNGVSGEEHKEEIQEPSTILISDVDLEDFELDDLSEEEQEKVKEHVLSVVDDL